MAPHNYFLRFSLVTMLHFTSVLAKQESHTYIVHMDISAMPKAFSGPRSWYLSTLATVSDISTTTTIDSSNLIYSYTHVINGFSASLTLSELETLKNSHGYVSSIKDLNVQKDTTRTSQFLGLNSNSGVWPASKFGQDVIIGVVDSGVWPESDSYSDEGMADIPTRWKGACDTGTQFNSSLCNKKLIGARFFNKGLVASQKNLTISMNSTRDTEGHGTHTSSTAAGNYVNGASYFGYAPGTARGVAPRAHVAMYKALFDEGAVASDLIAAIDQAIEDGVDVLSMSLGIDGLALYEDPLALATFAAIEKGIFVSTSAGNSGPFVKTLHNGTPWVLTVAAGTIDRALGALLTLGNAIGTSGYALYPGNFTTTLTPIVFIDQCETTAKVIGVEGKIVVCQYNENLLSDQTENVMSANATGGIFFTNSTDIEFLSETSFPAIFITPTNAEIIKNYITTSKEPKASMQFKKTFIETKPAPTVTSYSSRGPSPNCPFVLKPDIMGPGNMVLAAWPSNNAVGTLNSENVFTNYNLLSGTSMSCPHLTGVAALLKSVYPNWSPAAIRSAMMTTADLTDNTENQITDAGTSFKPASPLAMGAGQVNPNKAMEPGLIYDLNVDDYVNLLCGLNYTTKQIQTITRSSTTNCSSPSLDLNYPSFIAFFNTNDRSTTTTLKEFQRTVTNVGEGISTYIAKVPQLKGLKVSVTPDKLVFKEVNEKQSYKLTIEGPTKMKELEVFGFLIWEESGGKYVVKSPIVATSLGSEIVG